MDFVWLSKLYQVDNDAKQAEIKILTEALQFKKRNISRDRLKNVRLKITEDKSLLALKCVNSLPVGTYLLDLFDDRIAYLAKIDGFGLELDRWLALYTHIQAWTCLSTVDVFNMCSKYAYQLSLCSVTF